MMHQNSYRARRVIGQLQSNEEIVSELTKLCASLDIKAGEVRLSGALKSIELARFDKDEKDYVKTLHGGPVEIVTLHGTVGMIGNQVVLRLDALASADLGFGVQLVSGQVRRAVVETCEFVLDVFEDLEMVRGRDAKSGRLTLTDINTTMAPPVAGEAPVASPAPAAVEPEQSTLSWGDVSAASGDSAKPAKPAKPARAAAEPQAPAAPAPTPEAAPATHSILESDDDYDEDEDRPDMKPGDVLEHPKLGRCRIMKVEEDDYAHIRLPRGKISKLVLDIFEVQYKGVEDGRNVFSLRLRK